MFHLTVKIEQAATLTHCSGHLIHKKEKDERERGDLASDSTRDTSVIIYYKVGKMGNYNEEEKQENDNNNYSASCVSFKPRALIMLV